MPRQRRTPLALAVTLALALAAPAVALAEPEPEAATDATEQKQAEAKGPAAELPEVTVTATRRAEPLQKVPVAVSAFNVEELRDMQARTVEGLQGAVPNLNIVQGRGSSFSANVFIRGIGQPDALQTFDPGVGMYVDDVYYSRIQGALFSLFDVERIEVLRGPQGTLYGKNSTGGAIKLVTRDPSDHAEGSVELLGGDSGRLEARMYAATPIADTLSVSLAAISAGNQGYVDDPVTDKHYNDDDVEAARVKLLWRPTESFTARFAADYTHMDDALTLGRAEAPLTQLDFVRGVVVLRPPEGGEYDYETRTSFGPGQQYQKLLHSGVSLGLDWQLSDEWLLKSISAYRWLTPKSYIDIDATELELGDVFVEVRQKQFSQELQLQYDNGENLKAVGGLYYLNEDLPSEQAAFADSFLAFNGVPLPFTRTVRDDLSTDSWAAFLHAEWMFAPTWTLAAGVRYTSEDKDYFRTTTTYSTLAALRGTFAFEADDSWNATTPSIALQKQFTDNIMGYVSANRGFKSGGFNGRANSATEVSSFDPEYVWTYEAGVKMASSDRRLLGNIAVFHSDYEDFQARVSEVLNPGAPIPTFAFPVLNAAKLSIDGIEFEGRALIGEGTQVAAQVGYLDAEYDEFDDPRVTFNPALASLHDHVPFSPEWTARLAASHSFYLSGGSVLTFGGDVSWRDDTWLSVDNRDVLKQDAYTLVGLYGVFDTADGHWQFRGGVKNLTDEVYKTDAQEFSSVGNIQTAYYGWPRNWYVSARYTF